MDNDIGLLIDEGNEDNNNKYISTYNIQIGKYKFFIILMGKFLNIQKKNKSKATISKIIEVNK